MKKNCALSITTMTRPKLSFLICCLLGMVALISIQASGAPASQVKAPPNSTAAIDPALKAETHKSALQRRREAAQRLRGTEKAKAASTATAKDSKKAATAPKKAVAAPLSSTATSIKAKAGTTATSIVALAANSTPTGINPLVDITLPNFANSPNIRKFVDSLPGLGAANANNLGQYISVASPDPNAYPGSDYYEIALIRYTEKLHSDLPATDLRGYIQLETPANAATSLHLALKYPDNTPILNTAGQQVYAYDNPMYLGPVIVAQRGRAVRIKFTNYLPKGAAGNLPLPVDTTIMGAGMGPLMMNTTPGFPMNYTQNRSVIHLHGGLTPWISDGTPHQWIAPAGELTDYPKGVAVQNVPDMPDPGAGSMNFYYTNNQAARLMFYHDHAYGITRLNVYAGVAAGYLITSPVEQDLINGTNASGGNPGGAVLPTLGGAYPLGIPLVIQDRTFVNDATTPPGPGFTGAMTTYTAVSDPLWYNYVAGTKGGNLWLPHEYLPNENIYNTTGFNDMGRWDYAPWMIPPMPVLNNTMPSPTLIPETYGDTALVNGTAFPYVNIPPTLVRFRILNACNDRMLNLQLYKVDPLHPTEVKMVAAAPTAGFPATWPRDGRDGGVPDPATAGPDWWQIGNECGMLAQLNVVPQQAVDYDYSRRSATFGGVTSKALLMPPAVRADVIVDLSKYTPGDTLILYNDAPAPMPLYDTRNDFYTGAPDQRSIGGAPPSSEGYGPNTRTLMQIRITTPTVALTPPPANYLSTLKTALPKAYAVEQDPPVVNEAPFNAAYGATYGNIYANSVAETLNTTGVGQTIKQIFTTAPGVGYTTPPVVNIYGGGGSGASATATLNGVTGFTLLTAGSGYTSVPTATITAAPGDTGVGATATASVSGGVVTAITLTNPGSNYLIAPTVTLTGGGAVTQATAQANITLGSLGAINLISAGSGYTSEPIVTLTGGGGTGGTAAALLNGAMIMTGKNLMEGFDMEYGRMNAQLGSTPNPLSPAVGAGPIVGAAFYVDPPTEILDAEVPLLWRISHIGVDSHAIHFHLFEVQVINRVDWTNVIKPPYPEEIGWKETIRTNPFEDIIVALRPSASKMKLPFGLPDSNRLLDPTMPAGSAANFLPIPPPVGVAAVAQITNVMTNFGWEYVWHCHLLGHEENDMMRPTVFMAPRALATAPVLAANATTTQVTLAWTDATPPTAPATLGNPANEIGFLVQRATGGAGAFATIATIPANTTGYVDSTVVLGATYRYQVVAYNAAGNSNSNTLTVTIVLPAPTNLAVTMSVAPPIAMTCTWVNNTRSNTGLTVQRATNAGFTTGLVSYTVTPGTVASYLNTTTLAANTTYYYRVRATAGAVTSAWSNTASISTAVPAAPSGLAAAMGLNSVVLNWVDNATNDSGVTIQRATNTGFTANLVAYNLTGVSLVTYTDTAIVLGTTYSYRVRATNAAGFSGWSNTLTIATPAVQTAPGAPAGVSALAGDGLALVSFTAPASNGGSAITGYTASATNGGNTITANGSTSPITIPGLTNGLVYAVTVTATNAIGTGPASSPAVNVTPAAFSATTLAIDATVAADQGTGAASVVSPAISTRAGNEILLAFIASDASANGANVQVNGVTGGTGLTWTLVRRTNTQRGTAEIWYAFSPAVQTNITVTVALSQAMPAMITVMSFTGVDTTGNGAGAIGASGTGNSAAGAPTASLVTTRANSWVLGVGCDWSNAINRTVGTGQTMVHQYLAPVGDTYWVQRRTTTTPTLGSTVTINDTAPTVDRYNLSIVEIRTP